MFWVTVLLSRKNPLFGDTLYQDSSASVITDCFRREMDLETGKILPQFIFT
jgi:hypothetical protein